MDVSTDWTTEGPPGVRINYDLERISVHSLRHSFANNVTRKDCSVPRKFRPFKLPHDIQNTARKKLRMLNNAQDLNDLRIPPNNRLEALKGNRYGSYSIRINNQWRICFHWENGNCKNVEITDYH